MTRRRHKTDVEPETKVREFRQPSPKCKRCRHWDKAGRCHRYPPTIVGRGDHWVSVGPDGWCGEWAEK